MTYFWEGRGVLATAAGGLFDCHLVEAFIPSGARFRASFRPTF